MWTKAWSGETFKVHPGLSNFNLCMECFHYYTGRRFTGQETYKCGITEEMVSAHSPACTELVSDTCQTCRHNRVVCIKKWGSVLIEYGTCHCGRWDTWADRYRAPDESCKYWERLEETKSAKVAVGVG